MNDVVVKEMPILNFTDEKEAQVPAELQAVCQKLSTLLDERLKTPPFFFAAFEAFHSIEEWYNAEKFYAEDQIELLIEKLRNLLEEIKGARRDKFNNNFEDVLCGYNLFLKHHCEDVRQGSSTSLETIYKSFWEFYKDIPQTKLFIKLFEFEQVKSYSEANCESIGSIMSMATASRRNLFPDNFAREVFLHFNLPPLHLFMETFIPETVFGGSEKKNKEYIHRGEGMLPQTKKFKYAELSPSIGNFRGKEHEKFNGVQRHCDIYRLHCFGST